MGEKREKEEIITFEHCASRAKNKLETEKNLRRLFVVHFGIYYN